MRLWYILTEVPGLKRKLKYIYLLWKYDVCPYDIGNLEYHIAKFILPRLKLFKQLANKTPYIDELETSMTMEQW